MKREVPPDSQTVATSSASQTRWQLDRIVAELRISREETHSIRRDGEARRAPSRDALDDRFHETGIDEAMIDGTGSMLVDSSFGKC